MSLWKTTRLPPNFTIVELDVDELKKRLINLIDQDNTEIIHLALQSIIEELDD